MKKILLSTVITVLCFAMLLCVCASAASSTGVDNYFSSQKSENAAELAQLKKSFDDGLGLSGSIKSEGLTPDFDSAYKHYGFNSITMVKDYKAAGSFNKLISNSYQWKVPLVSTDGSTNKIALFQKNNYGWSVACIVTNPDSNVKMYDKVFSDENAIKDKINQVANDVSDLKITSQMLYDTTFLYFVSNGKEYLVPYADGQIKTGLKDGTVYSVEDAMSILDYNYIEPVIDQKVSDTDIPQTYGGYTLTPRKHPTPLYIYVIIAAGCLVAASAATFALFKVSKRKKSLKAAVS